MEQNIIVATDFSPRSFEVITKALKFAQIHKYQVHVVHILEKGFFEMLKDENTLFKNSFDHIKEQFPTLTQEQFHTREDSLEDGIERYVKELNAAMVIIGSSGERGSVLRDFLGTSTKSIVRAIDVPTLVVKSTKQILEFNNILIPTDLSEKSTQFIDKIHTLFPHATIELIHSYTVPFEGRLNFYGLDKAEASSFQNNMRSITQKETNTFYKQLKVDKENVSISIIKDGLAPEAFVSYAQKKSCDLIAIHTTGSFSFFAFDLLEHSNLDILITKY